MKHIARIIILFLSVGFLLPSCSDNDDVWNSIPKEITEIINQYFPFSQAESCTETPTGWHIRLKNGPGMTFDKDYSWQSVNGYGMPLPQVLLFDQLPPQLYKYLEETSNLNDVFSMERTRGYYTLMLLDATVNYDANSSQFTVSDSGKSK